MHATHPLLAGQACALLDQTMITTTTTEQPPPPKESVEKC
jgi:hypothetical protein